MSARIAAVAEMTLRSELRRPASLSLLLALPLAFYLARHELVGQSVRFLAVGVAWAASTAAFFASTAARDVEPRLRVSGMSGLQLVIGRLLALLALAGAIAAAYLVLVAVDRPLDRDGAIALDLGVTALVGVFVGTAIGAVASRELEGALLLFVVAGMQFIVDPAVALSRALPFWSTRELATYAVDGPAFASLGAGLLHAGVVTACCAAVVAARYAFTVGQQAR
jgi:hypothetical protein